MNKKNETMMDSSSTAKDDHIKLIESLSNACAVSGDEQEVRKIVREQVEAFADDIEIDALGNMLVRKNANSENALKVMLSAHMDEVGFMLVEDDKNGIFRFSPVGGIDVRQVAGKAVWVGREHRPGIIGACPIHLVDDEDLNRPIPLDSLRIDIGPGGNDDIKAGDRVAFATSFHCESSTLFGKALDNRLGVALLIELIKSGPYPVELLAAFTVQEEVGLRGAGVAAYALQPDVAIAVDSTPAYEMPAWDDEENVFYNTHMQAGPAIYLADRGTLSDSRLIRYLADVAENENIRYQYRQPGGGGTDAGAIHLQRTGIPSVSVSVPGRYPHTAVMVASYDDWFNTYRLLHATLSQMNHDILERNSSH